MTRRLSVLLFLGLPNILLLGNRVSSAQEPEFRNPEYRVKAGYFYYLGMYVKWPNQTFAGAENEFVIGVLGQYPFNGSIDKIHGGFQVRVPTILDGRIVRESLVPELQGKKITIRQYTTVRDFQKNYEGCHILFVCRSADGAAAGETLQNRLDAVLERTTAKPVLIVAEAESENDSKKLAQKGAVVSYWNDGDKNRVKIKMFINRQAERIQQLTISSQLLRLSIVTIL